MKPDGDLRILFVEDVSSDFELACRILEKQEFVFTARCVDSREDFLAALSDFSPDVVVSDYAMPLFDGMEALRLSLEHDPQLPFILCTGSTNEETAAACIKAGATDYVIKEHLSRLPFAIKEAIQLRDVRREREAAREEQLKLERRIQQRQKLESLGMLAGGIAHDFNNILMVILGSAQLVLTELSPLSPARSRINDIEKAAQKAAGLCRQMLAYSGKASFSREPLNASELIREMVHLLKGSISKKAILNLNLEDDPPLVSADSTQIRQVVMNLIINASEALAEENGVITVSLETVQCDEEDLRKTELADELSPGRYLKLSVSDNGCGMDAETRQRLFDPFYTTKFAGRGLGLAAVLGIVRSHDGTLAITSEPGRGTVFTLLFPVLEQGEPRPADTQTSSLINGTSRQGTVLLADDEEILRSVVGDMLKYLGFTVYFAADGREAVDLYRERGAETDLVLLDLTMPRLDGIEAFNEIIDLDPEARVILVSGYNEEDLSNRIRGREPAAFLQKPYNIQKLRDTLSRVLSS
ncbi:MAG: hypothetical protein AVO39_07995 [delta proteobacterium MLS_D]|jgi:two-component system, cell cycle sensor histidine kinase and response regulator CckA|nr:MAG: hypothetical protein AVO39_07995 [delta proteobacterium MLS_D]